MIEDVLAQLKGVKKVGTGWVAKCPCHEDTHASLSIGEGTDGRILLYCHAGCGYTDIRDALGLTPDSDEEFVPSDWKGKPIVQYYDYRDENGNLLYVVCRTADKEFPAYDPHLQKWRMPSKRVLFHLPDVIRAVADNKTLFIVEGEKDVLTLNSLGHHATCSPGGAGQWKEEYTVYLYNANVCIIADNDEPGKAHARMIAAQLEGVADTVVGAIALTGKDVTDHIEAGHSLDELQYLDLSVETINLLYAKEAEEALLGAMLTDEDAIDIAGDILDKEDFYSVPNSGLFDRMLNLFASGTAVDPVTVGGGTPEFSRLKYLSTNCPSTANAELYATQIKTASQRRQLAKAGETIIREASSARGINDVFDIADKVLTKAMRADTREQPESMYDLCGPAGERVQASALGESRAGIQTHIATLDDLICGLEPGAFVIIGASPSKGKTALLLNILGNVCVDHNAALFSLEMTKEEIIDRMVCTQAEVSLVNYRSGAISDEEQKLLMEALEPLSKLNLMIDDVSVSLPQIIRKARRLGARKPLDIIGIDYVQLMTLGEKAEGSVQEMTAISRGLKLLAKEMHACVIGVSQLSRPEKGMAEAKPQLYRLRQSGALEQDADIVCFIHDIEKDGPITKRLIVAKNRNGKTGESKIYWTGAWTKFEDM